MSCNLTVVLALDTAITRRPKRIEEEIVTDEKVSSSFIGIYMPDEAVPVFSNLCFRVDVAFMAHLLVDFRRVTSTQLDQN